MALSTITAKTKITASTFNAVVNAVNSIQLSNPQAYITETWISGSSWYRKWNDGWIEQGGTYESVNYPTVTFNLAYTNTNYVFMTACIGFHESTRTTTTIKFDSAAGHDTTVGGYWYACRILTFHSKRTQFSEKEIAQNERIFYWSNFFGRIPS